MKFTGKKEIAYVINTEKVFQRERRQSVTMLKCYGCKNVFKFISKI